MENRSLFSSIAVGTNIAMGYSLEDALAMLSGMGVEQVELSSIAGMCEHIEPARIDGAYVEYVAGLLEKNKLKCPAVSGHVDLTLDDQFRDFLKKIKFTAGIGARFINTNSGPIERLDIFRENMKQVIAQAEKYNVTICLETHGDIISTARDSVCYIQEFDHPLIRMNYDTGNAYFHSGGQCRVVEDIEYSQPYIEYMHIKDMVIKGDNVQYCAIGQGDLDFPAILRKLQAMGKTLPACLEIPVFVGGTLSGIGPRNTPLSEEAIKEAIASSFEYLEKTLATL